MKKIVSLLMVLALSLTMAAAQSASGSATTTDKSVEANATVTTEKENKDAEAREEREAKYDNNKQEVMDRLREAGSVLNELMAAPDSAIPEYILERAECVAVIPNMVKGGFVFGARHGRGAVTCKTARGWSAPAFLTITGGSWGAQIGVQSVDLVMLFMNQEAAKKMLKRNFKLGADASVAAGPVGRDAQAATDFKMDAQILTYSRTKGLFAGLTLNGAGVRPDEDSTRAFYGRNLNYKQTLSGNVAAPADASEFISSVRKHFRAAVTK